MQLSVAQQRAIYNPVSKRADITNRHHHQYKDVHGRVVSATVTVCRYESVQFGRPVWDARVSLGNGKRRYRLTNDRLADAYVGAVMALMGVGEDVEYLNIDTTQTVFCLRITMTDEEVDLMEKLGGKPALWLYDFPPENEQPRPPEHFKPHKWMTEKMLGTLFVRIEVDDPTKEFVKPVKADERTSGP